MGSVTLTLEAANPPCLSDFDQMILTLEALPIVDAGNDATIDIGSSYTITNASVQNAANFAWSSSGTGAFDDINSISPTYTPSDQDFALGSVQLTVTADGQGNCTGEQVSDYMILTVTNYPPLDFFWNESCGGSPVEFFCRSNHYRYYTGSFLQLELWRRKHLNTYGPCAYLCCTRNL